MRWLCKRICFGLSFVLINAVSERVGCWRSVKTNKNDANFELTTTFCWMEVTNFAIFRVSGSENGAGPEYVSAQFSWVPPWIWIVDISCQWKPKFRFKSTPSHADNSKLLNPPFLALFLRHKRFLVKEYSYL